MIVFMRGMQLERRLLTVFETLDLHWLLSFATEGYHVCRWWSPARASCQFAVFGCIDCEGNNLFSPGTWVKA